MRISVSVNDAGSTAMISLSIRLPNCAGGSLLAFAGGNAGANVLLKLIDRKLFASYSSALPQVKSSRGLPLH